MRKIRVGIIGTGSIARAGHIKAYLAREDVDLVACCDIDKGRAEKFAEDFGFKGVYTDYKEMLQKENLDAVSVCVWNSAHAEVAIAALEAGVNVLSEKPMAMSAAEGMKMKEAAEKSGKLLMIGFVRRFGTKADIAKALVDGGELGKVYYAKTKCIRRCGNPGGWFADKNFSGGGPLIDLGVHMIDLARYLMGKPKAVRATGFTAGGIGAMQNIKNFSRYTASNAVTDVCNVEDFATALVHFDNGAVLHVEVSFCGYIEPKEELTLDVLGDEGGLRVEPDLKLFKQKYDRLMDVTPVYNMPPVQFNEMFGDEISHFIDCVKGEAECRNTPDDGIELMKILDAIYESARTGKEVEI